jgi:hypothetical protein
MFSMQVKYTLLEMVGDLGGLVLLSAWSVSLFIVVVVVLSCRIHTRGLIGCCVGSLEALVIPLGSREVVRLVAEIAAALAFCISFV